MENRLDMSLDDLIKKNKSSSSSSRASVAAGAGGARGGRHGGAPPRRFANRAANRSAPYSVSRAPETLWQHDMYRNQGGLGGGGGASSIETGTKLYISNLDYGVSNDDLKELFSEVGDLKRFSVHYDRSGRSKGTAEIVFSRRNDALAAVKRYNNVELDGKPMKIEIVGTNVANAGGLPPAVNGYPRNPPSFDRGGRGRGGPVGRPRGGRGFGRGRGRERSRNEKISAEDLDAELEKYHSAASKTEEPMKTDE
ncbi:hypothetical protein vseg_021096 [Gypsophila vaccaria]